MPGLIEALNSAKLALSTQQIGIQVTGHNIANVNTDGYSRQESEMKTTRPYSAEPGQIGTGVTVSQISRQFDRFLQKQITDVTSNFSELDARNQALKQVESTFNESSGNGINNILSEFWNSWQDVANNPQGASERVALRAKAQDLVDTFNRLSSDLTQQRTNADRNVVGAVGEINLLTSQIAELNSKIAQVEVGDQNANDYRDQRERLIQDLSKKIDINYFEGDNHMVAIFAGQGKSLVEGTLNFNLSGDMNTLGYHDVMWENTAGTKADVGTEIQSGSLKGFLDARDTLIPKYLNDLNELAASIVIEVNRQHEAGYSLDGTTGNTFFAPLTSISTTTANTTGLTTFTEVDSGNVGGATINTGTVADRTLVNGDDYEIRFKSFLVDAGNNTLNVTTTNGTASVTLTASVGQTGAALAADVQARLNASGVLTGAGADTMTVSYIPATDTFSISINNGKTVTINTAASTANTLLGFTADPAAASSITSDSASGNRLYDIVNTTTGTTLSSNASYTSGSTITFDGVSVIISDGSSAPENGDIFGIKFTRQAAENMSLSSDVQGSVNKIAAAQTSAGVPGDNTNALSIAALQNSLTMEGNQATFDTYYNTVVGSVGVDAQGAQRNTDLQQLLVNQLQGRRDSVSGVSLDEELTNLIKFQHAFQAAAKVVTVIDELLDTVIKLTG
ncbi:MAG TPA: flagellar hook-associated protein FlgK [bacterium]|nr:flagellar hook-associated protein FlgK [bacterium]